MYLPKVAFGNFNLDLDLNFKLIDLKSKNFKFNDVRSYFKSMYFKSLKSFVDFLNPNL